MRGDHAGGEPSHAGKQSPRISREPSFFEKVIAFLFPPRCVACRARGVWLCDECRPQLPLIQAPVCPHCGAPVVDGFCPTFCARLPRELRALRTAGYFEGPLRQAIHRLKFSGERYLAEPLGELLATAWRQAPMPVDYILPVPMHPEDQARRGYNQSILLAREAGQLLGVEVLDGVLRKERRTAPQVGLARAERLQNLSGAFVCRDATLAGKAVALVDDVTTTGATLAACAQALRAAGVGHVYGLVLARVR